MRPRLNLAVMSRPSGTVSATIFVQEGYQSVLAVPYDMPIVGYGNNVVNTLRIWDAQPIDTFSLSAFDKGDYQKAVEQENLARTWLRSFIRTTTTMRVKSCVLNSSISSFLPAYRLL